MISHRIPLLTVDMFSHLPDQTTELINRLVEEVNEYRYTTQELTNEIIVLKNQVKRLTPTPTPPSPSGDWQQVLLFDPANMGTTPGLCLQNCRLGFGIQTATYGSAYEDMLAQKSNGTLHETLYPPNDIQVPIYIRTGAVGQHVVVWDRGVVYSDGVQIHDWVGYYGEQNIYGWGEFCDGVRVVAPTV